MSFVFSLYLAGLHCPEASGRLRRRREQILRVARERHVPYPLGLDVLAFALEVVVGRAPDFRRAIGRRRRQQCRIGTEQTLEAVAFVRLKGGLAAELNRRISEAACYGSHVAVAIVGHVRQHAALLVYRQAPDRRLWFRNL